NYIGGAIWPPVVQHFVETVGWRQTYLGTGIFVGLTMMGFALCLRKRPPLHEPSSTGPVATGHDRPFGLAPSQAQVLLCIAGIASCVAMSMPQVHIVAYCGDLGYGPARGAEMLAVMLGFGVVSRLTFGVICDRIGGLRTLALSSALQAVALVLFLPFN